MECKSRRNIVLFCDACGDIVKVVYPCKLVTPKFEIPLNICLDCLENGKLSLDLGRKAKIAYVFIDKGFHYLAYASTQASITLSHKRTINEALDLANYLVQSFKPEKERNYIVGDLLP